MQPENLARHGSHSGLYHFKMEDRKGLAIWTIFITAKCKVNAANNTLPMLKDVFTKCTPKFRGWRRAVRKIWLSRTSKLYDHVTSNSCQCGAAQVHFPGKEW